MKNTKQMPDFSYEEFCNKLRTFNPMYCGKIFIMSRISMHDVFNRPKYSKTGFPKILKCNVINKLTRDLVGRNVAELMLNPTSPGFNDRIGVRTITPAKDGICVVNVVNMEQLIKVIGIENVISIYNYMSK